MRYTKGAQAERLDDLPSGKVNLVRDGDVEGIWVKRGPGYFVLQNHALAFGVHSWGAVFPEGAVDVSHMSWSNPSLELHPDAWDQYVEHQTIDAEGNHTVKALEE